MTHLCIKCNKKFKYNSDLNKHISRKTPCDKEKNNLRCNVCNVNFSWPAEQIRHEKTKKHITNINLNKESKNELENTININNQLETHLEKIKQLEIELENEKNKNKRLETENKILKKNNKEKLIDEEQIYIIQERTFVELNLNVYKIGRTKNLNRRFKEYSNGSKLLFTIPCNNSVESETKILNYLKNNNEKYIQTKEYGNEYFRCNLNDLIQDIITNI